MAGFTIAGDGALKQRRVNGVDDLAQGDQFRAVCEQVASCLAAAALDESCTAQIIENLHKKVCRDVFPLRKVLKPCKSLAVMVLRELRERPTGILQLLRNLHE